MWFCVPPFKLQRWVCRVLTFLCAAYRDTADAVNPEETAAVMEDEKKPEDAPQSEVEKDKDGAENEEEEKEPEDKVYF